VFLLAISRNFALFDACFSCKNCLSTRCASPTNVVCREVDVFGAKNVLLSRILCYNCLHPLSMRRYLLHALFFIQVYRGRKSCSSLLENASLRVPTCRVRDFSTFSVRPSKKHCPSARCAYAANVVATATGWAATVIFPAGGKRFFFMLCSGITVILGLFPSSNILENRKHDVSETGSVSVLRWGGRCFLDFSHRPVF
jgi:hypothetical protein